MEEIAQVFKGIYSRFVGRFWDARLRKKRPARLYWWDSETIIRHVNKNVCGQPLSGLSQGVYATLKERFAEKLPLTRAISVGCGTGTKEMQLIKQGIVQHIDLFEFSAARIEAGNAMARKEGCSERMHFHHGNAFDLVQSSETYDAVFWNNSLHHMRNVEQAIAWSHRILKKGGLFIMDDFVGPSRLQWTARMLKVGTCIRQILPDRYLKSPHNPLKQIKRKLSRPSRIKILLKDPSECADSARILGSLRKYFPDADVKPTGGVVYHAALEEVIHNIDEEKDAGLLNSLLAIDDLCVSLGDTHYAVAIAEKV